MIDMDKYISFCNYTDRGTRLVNEDRSLVSVVGSRVCATLADGVGGSGGGSTAAATVTLRMEELFREKCENTGGPLLTDGADRIMKAALDDINSTVISMQTPRYKMQATCVALWLERSERGWTGLWAHTGDSRLYLFEKGKLRKKTSDHSLAELWKKDPLKKNVSKNIIWQAMGSEEGIKPDITGPVPLNPGTAFLLCSDGVWGNVNDKKITAALACSETPEQWLENIRAAVKVGCGTECDNNTAIAVFLR